MTAFTRLNININSETHAALLHQPADVTITEAVRRAVALYKLLTDAVEDGSRIQLVKGCDVRELTFHDGQAG
jgi:hypothetical protein